jgi:asparagine synthase (glutamine-hydrolysing)
MCGIAGFVTLNRLGSGDAVLRQITDTIHHRGPDDAGYYSDGVAWLGHRRLSIIDLAAGHQPMPNESASRWIVFNGEIFNHIELRPDLEAAGHVYSSRSDTETILHAWEQYGDACVTRFRGMFAFAIWDQESRTLFCARDRLGIKPFYYFWNGRVFAFASEIKALLEHPEISAEPEETLFPEYLAFGYVSEERTLFRNIRKLMPGHSLRLDMRASHPEPRITQYWNVPPAGNVPRRSDEDWIAETRHRLEEAVRTRLMSDVPLGMFLSGGVDSSAIAALIRRMTGGPVKTFSVGYAEQAFSELGHAAQVARAIGTDHHEVVVGMDEFFGALPRLIWHEDEPISWPSSVSLHFVSRLASEQVKVVLTGEGSDELFGGYERYRWNLLNLRGAGVWRFLPERLRRLIGSSLATTPLLQADLRRKLRHTFVGRDLSIESLFLDNFYCAFSREEQNRLLASPSNALYANYLRYWNERPHDPFLPRMLYADQKTYLVELLMKQDQMSMSASVESRVPFLDHHLVEFSASLPDHLRIRGGEQKYVLKKAVEDLLPREIVYRRKMGFPTPLRQWLREPRAEPLLSAIRDRKGFLGSFLNLDSIDSLVERHRAGLEDATDRIWRLLNLQIWGDIFFNGRHDYDWEESVRAKTSAA